MAKNILVGVIASLALGVALPTQAATITAFSTDTTAANFASTYSDWTFLGSQGSADVSGGQLRFTGSSMPTQVLLYNSTFSGAFTFAADIGTTNSFGNYNAGLFIGLVGSEAAMLTTNFNNDNNANRIVFHPGFFGSALRIEGGGGFWNTDIGWTPANGTMTNFSLAGDGLGSFTLTLTDNGNPSLTYTTSFTNNALSGQALEIGLTAAGAENTNYALFDNPSVSTYEVPEPACAAMLAIGLTGLVAARRGPWRAVAG